MYSDDWRFNNTLHKTNRVNLTNVADYYTWVDAANNLVGVTVNFETAEDFHYELLASDWWLFQEKVLNLPIGDDFAQPFADFLAQSDSLFYFEHMLGAHNIKYKKIAFY